MGRKVGNRGFAMRGVLLRSLRADRGWSQSEAAKLAGVSDRTLRTAEAGGRVDSRSAMLLAELYSKVDFSLTVQDLLTTQGVGQETTSAAPTVVLERLLCELWKNRRMVVIDELLATQVSFHCEMGGLSSPVEYRRRVEQIQSAFTDFSVHIIHMAGDNEFAFCRWQLMMTSVGRWRGVDPTGQRITATVTTNIRLKSGEIVSGWEFWDANSHFQTMLLV